MRTDIREIPLGGDLRAFLDVVNTVYADDPCYVRPLDFDLKERLSKKNPFFRNAEGTIFVAFRNGKPVGRITAQIDRGHLARYEDATGFFGFLDTIDDEEVCTVLIERAKDWLRARGMKRIRGPLSLNINEEMGCLIDGFDTPPMILMPHHRPYQSKLIEKAGLSKVKDVYAWKYYPGEVTPRAAKAHAEVAKLPEVKVRKMDRKHLARDVRLVMDIFNDAWSENWGSVPLSEAELAKMAQDMKLILDPELTRIAEIDGEPAAFVVALPNINEAIRDLNGQLFPFGVAKLLYRLKVQKPRTVRLALLGIRKKFRKMRQYAGLSTYLYVEMNESGRKLGVQMGELSWTLEDNGPVNVGIKMMGGKIYKTYRVYEGEL